jgi:hypothetical protein
MNTTELDGRTSGFHPAHVGHLVMGLAFLGLVGIWAVIETGTVATSDVRWLLPLPWVFAGAAGLVAAVFSGRRGARADQRAAYAAAPAVRRDDQNDLDIDQEEE